MFDTFNFKYCNKLSQQNKYAKYTGCGHHYDYIFTTDFVFIYVIVNNLFFLMPYVPFVIKETKKKKILLKTPKWYIVFCLQIIISAY